MTKIFQDKIKFFIVLLIWSFYTINILNYPLQFQHDTWLHHYELARILTFNFSDFNSEYGILYYIYVATFGVFTYPLYLLDVIEAREGLYLTIKLSNIFLVLTTILIILKFSEKLLFIKKDISRFIPVLIFFSLAPTERVFMMCRPETIMIPLTLISVYYFCEFLLEKNLKFRHIIIFIICTSFLGLQKSTGFLFVLFVFFYAFLFIKNLRNFPKYALIISAIIILYFIFHFYLTGIPFYEIEEVRRNEEGEVGLINLGLSWEVFYKINLFEAFKYPVRETIAQAERPFGLSIPYVFLIDIFGDYFLYGKFRYLDRSSYLDCVPYLNRASILFGLVFFSLILISSLKTFYHTIKLKIDRVDLFLNLQIYYAIFLLALATFMRMTNYGGVIKLDYIIFFISLTCLSFTKKLNNYSKKTKKILFLLTLLFCIYSMDFFKCNFLVS